jgi:hypothetical protein
MTYLSPGKSFVYADARNMPKKYSGSIITLLTKVINPDKIQTLYCRRQRRDGGVFLRRLL